MAQYNSNMNTQMSQEKPVMGPSLHDGGQYPNHNMAMSPPPAFSEHAQTPPANPGYEMQQPVFPQQAYAAGYNQQQPPMMYTHQQQPTPSNQYMGQVQGQQQGRGAAGFSRATAIPNLGMGATPVDCPNCGQRAMTNITYQAGNTTHVWALITFCFTWCLCFIPYMMNTLKDVQHKCGNCGALLATWHKSGQVEVYMNP